MKREGGWLVWTVVGLTMAVAAAVWSPALLSTLRGARKLGVAAPVLFVVVHVVGVVAFVPATVFAVAAGALFGLTDGVAYSLVGGSLGALGAFLIGRYGVRRLVAERFAASRPLAIVDRAIAEDAARILVLLRLSPVMPFNVLNYALGVSSIRLRDFLLGLLGMIPGTMAAAYAGQLTGDALATAGTAQRGFTPSYYVTLGVGVVATVLAAFVLTRIARRAIGNVA